MGAMRPLQHFGFRLGCSRSGECYCHAIALLLVPMPYSVGSKRGRRVKFPKRARGQCLKRPAMSEVTRPLHKERKKDEAPNIRFIPHCTTWATRN